MARVRLLLALALWSTAGLAQGVLIPERWIPPAPVPPPVRWAPLQQVSQRVAAELRDGAATTVVEQRFHNQYGHRLEGLFLFPLPAEAAVTDFGMTVNGQMVSGELLDAGKARGIYEEIVRRQRDPGLMEYLGRGLFRIRIFPIEAGETKAIRLEYTQALTADSGLARYVFPLRNRAFHNAPPPVVRPMHHGGRKPAGSPLDGEPGGQASIGTLTITANIESKLGLKSVYSPTHDIAIKRDGENRARVSYEGRQVAPEEDFVLFVQQSDKAFGLNLLTYHGSDDSGHFMLLLAPKSELRESEIQAKDIVFVCDVSGSMSGEKLKQSQEALTFCLRNLNKGDRFNVISFSTDVDSFRPALVPASEEAVKEAVRFVGELKARGGTNIGEAVGTALRQLARDETRPALVMFLTDGQPTVGETRVERLLEAAGEANRSKARLFVFGVGDDVNTVLLDRLSDDNNGTRTFVRPGENIEAAVSSLYAKITSPVLSDLQLDVQGVKIADLQPLRLPDLFRGSQLTVVGRYEGAGAARVTLRGKARGQEQVFEYSADFPRQDRSNPFLPRLWATRRVGYLLDQIRLHGQAKELIEEVVRLATRYGILTPYTSYLVLEPGATTSTATEAGGALRDRRVDAAPGMPGMGGGAGPAGAPAPSRPTEAKAGRDAVDRSQAEGQLRRADRAARSEGGLAVKESGERTYYLIDGVWVDSTYPKEPGQRTTIKVKYGSDAWFELAGRSTELRDILAVGQKVKAVIGKVLLIIGDDGDEQLSADARKLLG